jgi:hypothetical protein
MVLSRELARECRRLRQQRSAGRRLRLRLDNVKDRPLSRATYIRGRTPHVTESNTAEAPIDLVAAAADRTNPMAKTEEGALLAKLCADAMRLSAAGV